VCFPTAWEGIDDIAAVGEPIVRFGG
jgi:hypothetical protein